MAIFGKVTLQWRILGGFFLCAMLTGVSVGVGIWTLQMIQSNMDATTKEIGRKIDRQNSRISQLMPLRTLVSHINNAETPEELSKRRNQFEQINIIGDQENILEIYQAIDNLIIHKQNQLKALFELDDLRRTTVRALEEVNTHALSIAEDAEKYSTIEIVSGMSGIKDKFDTISSEIDISVSTVKSLISLRSHLAGLAGESKEGLFADPAFMGYAESIIVPVVETVRNEIQIMPKSKVTVELIDALHDLEGYFKSMLEMKAAYFNAAGEEKADLAANLLRTAAQCSASIDGAVVLSMNIIGEDSGSGKEKTDDNMVAAMERALTTIKAAMSLRSYCSDLNTSVKDALLIESEAGIDAAKNNLEILLENAGKELNLLPRDETTVNISETLGMLEEQMRKMFGALKKRLSADEELGSAITRIRTNMAVVDEHIIEVADRMKTSANAMLHTSSEQVRKWQYYQLLLMFVAVFLALGVGVLTSISMNKEIEGITDGMSGSVEKVASASMQVSSTNQELVEGASRQAQSLERTTASVKSIISSTKKNEESANQVNEMMDATSRVVAQATQSMAELIESIEEISKIGEETTKIIQTIDEIAFQTKLLALNAAVEAARAGQAGVSFAVVANEVRGLAGRAAEAVQNTTGLTEKIIARINAQTEIVTRTNQNFEELSEKVSKVDSLVHGIVEAFTEQTQGIDQINAAVGEMDTVVQQNLTNAEKSVSAYKELETQTENILSFIRILKGLEEKHIFQKNIRVTLEIEGEFIQNGHRPVPFITKNISMGGACIESDRFIESGSVGKIRFKNANIRIPLMKGKIVREIGAGSDDLHTLGVKFLDLKPREMKRLKSLITDVVKQKQKDEKKLIAV